jgi:hypothetical protein
MRTLALAMLVPVMGPYCSPAPPALGPGWSRGPALPEAVQEMHPRCTVGSTSPAGFTGARRKGDEAPATVPTDRLSASGRRAAVHGRQRAHRSKPSRANSMKCR